MTTRTRTQGSGSGLPETGSSTQNLYTRIWNSSKRIFVEDTSRSTHTTSPFITTYGTSTMTDVITPGYHNIMKSGGIVNNSMSQNRLSRTITPCHVGVHASWEKPDGMKHADWSLSGVLSPADVGICNASGVVNPLTTGGVDTPANLEEQIYYALANAWQSVVRSPSNVWVNLGELDETTRELVSLFRRIQILLDFRRKPNNGRLLSVWRQSLRGGRHLTWHDLKLCSSHWLEVRYGLMPMIREVRTLIKILKNTHQKRRHRFTAPRNIPLTSKSATTVVNRTANYKMPGNTFWSYALQATVTREIDISAGVLVDPTSDETTINDLMGVGNVVQGLWDLVPYSFVVQWLVDVSSFLSAYAPGVTVIPLAAWGWIRNSYTVQCSAVNGGNGILPVHPTYGPLVGGGGGVSGMAVERVYTFNRVANPPRPMFPEVRVALRISNGVDLLCLVAQNLRRFC